VRGLILHIISGILGLYLATRLIPEVEFLGGWQDLFLAGAFLGFINFFFKPILKFITLPLRILTFGLFSLVINMGMVWIVDIVFEDLIIPKIWPLFWTTLIIWGLSFIIFQLFQSKPKI